MRLTVNELIANLVVILIFVFIQNQQNAHLFVLRMLCESWLNQYGLVVNTSLLPDIYFKQQLRLSRDTFDILQTLLVPRLSKQNNQFRDAIAAEKVLALGLYRLAHGNSYKTIAPVFNVGKTTVIEAMIACWRGIKFLPRSFSYVTCQHRMPDLLFSIKLAKSVSPL